MRAIVSEVSFMYSIRAVVTVEVLGLLLFCQLYFVAFYEICGTVVFLKNV